MYDAIRISPRIANKEYLNIIIKRIKENKQFYKYPKRMVDIMMFVFMKIFGVKALILFLNKLMKHKRG